QKKKIIKAGTAMEIGMNSKKTMLCCATAQPYRVTAQRMCRNATSTIAITDQNLNHHLRYRYCMQLSPPCLAIVFSIGGVLTFYQLQPTMYSPVVKMPTPIAPPVK